MAEIKFGCDHLNEAQKYALEQCAGINTLEKNDHVATSSIKDGNKSTSVDGKRDQKRKVEIPDDITKSKYFKPGDLLKPNESKHKSKAMPQKLNRDQMIERKKIEREKQILKKLSRVFETMRESFDEMIDTLNRMHGTVCVIKDNLSKTATMTNALFSSDSNEQTVLIETSTADQESRRNRRASVEKPKGFEFPDNKDKSFKWTLRHKELTEGLIELLPKSGVYVRLNELEKLDFESDNPNQAALMLMKEIFSDHALSVCSLTGRGNRPALDMYSRKVMIMYLNEYCNKRRWKTDEPSVWTFLRNKLPEFRINADA